MTPEQRTERDRLIELFRSMPRPPSLVVAGQDDLTLMHGLILQELLRAPDQTLKEFADRIDRSVSQTSRLVDQLVRRGLVQRREDAEDRRVRRLRITPKGSALLRKVERIRAESVLVLWDYLTDEERPIVTRAMQIFSDVLERVPREAYPQHIARVQQDKAKRGPDQQEPQQNKAKLPPSHPKPQPGKAKPQRNKVGGR